MDKERLKYIMSGLNRYELTGLEKRFAQSVEQYFKEKNMLTDQQESILKGVYRENAGFKYSIIPVLLILSTIPSVLVTRLLKFSS